MKTLTREQVRQVDEIAINKYGMSGLVLMENAGRGVADVMCSVGIEGRVVICCGKGNNAGDGFVVARILQSRGHEVSILSCARPGDFYGDARANHDIAVLGELPIEYIDRDGGDWARLGRELDVADWIVDGLLGTGATGCPRPPMGDLISCCNAAMRGKKMALDIPSGLDCDTGEAEATTFHATHTCTFFAAKPGLLLDDSRQFVGELHVVDIGVPAKLLREFGVDGR